MKKLELPFNKCKMLNTHTIIADMKTIKHGLKKNMKPLDKQSS